MTPNKRFGKMGHEGVGVAEACKVIKGQVFRGEDSDKAGFERHFLDE